MNLKNLSVLNKKHKKILSHLNKKKISKIYNEFSSSLKVKEDLAVAVSGGADSLALAYLIKCYALKNKIKVRYYLINHKLRKEASIEAETVKKVLITNVAGTTSGYSKYGYDVVGATQNGTVYPSLDPSIFEVKYPTTDITGRVVNI